MDVSSIPLGGTGREKFISEEDLVVTKHTIRDVLRTHTITQKKKK